MTVTFACVVCSSQSELCAGGIQKVSGCCCQADMTRHKETLCSTCVGPNPKTIMKTTDFVSDLKRKLRQAYFELGNRALKYGGEKMIDSKPLNNYFTADATVTIE